MAMDQLLNVKQLTVDYVIDEQIKRAVDQVSFSLNKGEILAIMGESGSGKSSLALALLKLITLPGKIADGEVWFENNNLMAVSEEKLRQVRGGDIAFLFQDPFTSLNPAFTIGSQIGESVALHQKLKGKALQDEVVSLLGLVQFTDPKKWAESYPHQLSGGMRQRAMLAMALAGKPKLLIADEPTTALDVTIQYEILKLLKDLQARLGLSILLVTHNFKVARFMSQRVLIMKDGKIVAEGNIEQLLQSPPDLYTANLVSAYRKIAYAKY